ncbi:MAG: CcdB family protein [Spongiibacteraceae bacterium]
MHRHSVVAYNGEKLLLLTLQLASIPSKTLKAALASLMYIRDEIIAAIDFAITGI